MKKYVKYSFMNSGTGFVIISSEFMDKLPKKIKVRVSKHFPFIFNDYRVASEDGKVMSDVYHAHADLEMYVSGGPWDDELVPLNPHYADILDELVRKNKVNSYISKL